MPRGRPRKQPQPDQPQRQRHTWDEETKAKAMALLLTGQSVDEVAVALRIPEGTIKAWASKAKNEAANAIVQNEQQGERLGGLILDNLEIYLGVTKEMAENIFTDKDWLRKQEASQLAILFGVISDKTYRLLTAIPDRPEPEPKAPKSDV